jgi:hypothetical protein
MKKLVFAALAASTLSTPALAADWQGLTYGQDAWGIYTVNANVASFCKFGATNNVGVNGNNSTVTVTSESEADGNFALDIQDVNDDTVKAADGEYDIGYAVCNQPFDMQLSSQNGGLLSDTSTSDPAFIENVPYQVKFAFDGNHANANSSGLSSSFTTITSVTEARAGAAHVQLLVNAHDKLLLEGTYADVLQARLSPTI